mgnify:CR=1 FL=1
MADKKDLVDYGIDKVDSAVEKGVDLVNNFLDWITGAPYASSSSKKVDDDKDKIECHCTVKK